MSVSKVLKSWNTEAMSQPNWPISTGSRSTNGSASRNSGCSGSEKRAAGLVPSGLCQERKGLLSTAEKTLKSRASQAPLFRGVPPAEKLGLAALIMCIYRIWLRWISKNKGSIIRNMRAFESFRYKNFKIFWLFQIFSLAGTWMQMVAQGWLVYEITGSKLLLGLLNAIAGLPILFLTPFGGVIADHVNKKKLLWYTQLVFALSSFLVGFLISTGQISFAALALITFLVGVANALDAPARQAFVVELTEKKALPNAIALNSIAFNAARIVGPAAAGFIIGAFGIEDCFYLNAMTFFIMMAGLMLIKGDFSPVSKWTSGMLEPFFEGARYIYRDKKTLLLMILVAFTSVLVMPYAVLMPVFAKDILKVGPQGLGLLMSAGGMGALLSAFMLAQYSSRINFIKYIIFSTIVVSLSLIAFSISVSFILSCAFLAVLGWGIVSQAACVNTVLQKEVPDRMRGRIMGFYTLSFLGLMPIGGFQAGVTAQYLGAPASLIIGGLICLIPAVPMALYLRK